MCVKCFSIQKLLHLFKIRCNWLVNFFSNRSSYAHPLLDDNNGHSKNLHSAHYFTTSHFFFFCCLIVLVSCNQKCHSHHSSKRYLISEWSIKKSNFNAKSQFPSMMKSRMMTWRLMSLRKNNWMDLGS